MSVFRKILKIFSFEGALKKAGKIPQSSGYLQPGDVVTFRYKNLNKKTIDRVIVLIVATKTSLGVKNTRTTGNRLITCFKLPGDGMVTREILKRLYKNRTQSTFGIASRMFGAVKALLGANKFRTYILGQVFDMHELVIDKREL